MLDFISKWRNLFFGAGLVLLSLGLLTSAPNDQGPLGRSGGVVNTPLHTLADVSGGLISSLFDRYIFASSAEAEINRLKTENDNLKQEVLKLKEFEYENTRLKALLGFKETVGHKLLPARVSGRSALAWYRTMVIDKGILEGVRQGSPVVTAGGVVGRVYEVSGSYARVLLLTDPNSAVDAILQRSRAQVVVEGDMGPSPKLLYLARGVDAEVGDKVITSGLDGIYPKGLLLGEISRLKQSTGEIFQNARLLPVVDFASIEEVFVILSPLEKPM